MSSPHIIFNSIYLDIFGFYTKEKEKTNSQRQQISVRAPPVLTLMGREQTDAPELENIWNISLQGLCAAAGLELRPKAPKAGLGRSLLGGICRYWAGSCLTPCYQFCINSSAGPFVPEPPLLSGLALLCLCPVCRQTITLQYLALYVCMPHQKKQQQMYKSLLI